MLCRIPGACKLAHDTRSSILPVCLDGASLIFADAVRILGVGFGLALIVKHEILKQIIYELTKP